MKLSLREELECLLRPAGSGLYVVSTGLAEQQALHRQLYGTDHYESVQKAWRASLDRISRAKVLLLGIPSDVGAGVRRGANGGPGALRLAWLGYAPHRFMEDTWIDVGDVFCVPQLLSDELLHPEQMARSQVALYPNVEQRADLPVSPLSIAARVLAILGQMAPQAKILLLGGDHSVAWPLAEALFSKYGDPINGGKKWGILQIDAHTDLSKERLGIPICFATWAYHANRLLGGEGRLVQIGIRATRFPKSHWEQSLNVRQFWATEILEAEETMMEEILCHVRKIAPDGIYLSNDIDGTDAHFADACGTPEPGGLSPEWLLRLMKELGENPGILAGDLVEVAPDLSSSPKTLETAVRYLETTLEALLWEKHLSATSSST